MKRPFITLLLLCCLFPARSQYLPGLPNVNKKTLALMREEQKLSRDVYGVFYGKWEHSVFGLMSEAETNHMEAVKHLLDLFEVNDPVEKTEDRAGVFVNKHFQQLYDSLVTVGTVSLEGAYRVGAYLEEKDILDLQAAIKGTASEDLKATYKYMMMASGRHLLTFARNLKKLGITYKPVLLARKEYDRLVGASGGGLGLINIESNGSKESNKSLSH